MNKQMWAFRILGRYALLQLPMIIFLIFAFLLSKQYESVLEIYILIFMGIWIIKDIALYPVVWQAYDAKLQKAKHTMSGLSGICIETLNPDGYVHVRGERWRARIKEPHQTIQKGERVYVDDNEGLTLLVRAINEKNSSR